MSILDSPLVIRRLDGRFREDIPKRCENFVKNINIPHLPVYRQTLPTPSGSSVKREHCLPVISEDVEYHNDWKITNIPIIRLFSFAVMSFISNKNPK